MPKDYFAGRIAENYDHSAVDMFEPEVVDPAVDFLADLAFDRSALELGIGTGRIALPLAQRGIRVQASICLRRWSPSSERSPAARTSM
jgi:hypothetical protein